MYLTISFGDGCHVDAVLLAMSRDRMRVVIPDQMDTVEFRLVYGGWITTALAIPSEVSGS